MKREARMANLGEADRRVAGLGSWPVVPRICLRPSAHEPAARDAEGKRPVSLRCLSKWTVALAAAAAVCCGERERERDPLVIGDNPNTSGNSFSYGVSAEFREPELRQLYAVLNGPRIRAKLQRYVCPQLLPPFTVTVVLWHEGPYQERLVRLQMTPPLYKADERLANGLGYSLEQTVRALDKGPPIDYRYRNPHDGSPIKTTPYEQYHEPEEGDCVTPRPATLSGDGSGRELAHDILGGQ